MCCVLCPPFAMTMGCLRLSLAVFGLRCKIPLWITRPVSHHYILAVQMLRIPHCVLHVFTYIIFFSWILSSSVWQCYKKNPPTEILQQSPDEWEHDVFSMRHHLFMKCLKSETSENTQMAPETICDDLRYKRIFSNWFLKAFLFFNE